VKGLGDTVVQLWVDDTKPAPPGMEAITSYHVALDRLVAGGIDILYLDFDLGHISWTGPGLLEELVERGGQIPAEVRGISSSSNCNRAIAEKVKELREREAKSHQTQSPRTEAGRNGLEALESASPPEPAVGIEPTTARSQH
jgi:hypothetical protein